MLAGAQPGDPRSALMQELSGYAVTHPEESSTVSRLIQFIARHEDCALRSQLSGHLTGAAWLVHPDQQQVLMLHHKKLDRWLQPGGHADGDLNLNRVALKEAEEESGLSGLVAEPDIFDIDIHAIPERKDVPDHYHYDIRYVVYAEDDTDAPGNAESHQVAWVPYTDLLADDVEESIRRMAQKWQQRLAMQA